MRGSDFPARVAASLLDNLGRPNLASVLAVATPKEYEALAHRLAAPQGTGALSRLRTELVHALGEHAARCDARAGGGGSACIPQFNAGQCVRAIERSYAAMWEVHVARRSGPTDAAAAAAATMHLVVGDGA